MNLISNDRTGIIILSTGGTIEKTYDEYDGSLGNRETVIKEKFLDRLRFPYLKFNIKAIMSKDSLDMDLQDRLIIYDAIRNFEHFGSPIIVLHGTDTMDQTIKVCFERSQDSPLKVPVIFTGAMKPLGFVDSDARQNVIESITCAQVLSPGFYLNFHGKVFCPPNIRKNKEKGTFESY
jgi:L-asparaginase